jgi:hypothetical protein
MIHNSEKQLEKLIIVAQTLVQSDGLEGVMHYLEHGEYEMSFEGLVIELMKLEVYPDGFNFSEWKELGLQFRLNEESVFDNDFWNKFLEWGESYN